LLAKSITANGGKADENFLATFFENGYDEIIRTLIDIVRKDIKIQTLNCK